MNDDQFRELLNKLDSVVDFQVQIVDSLNNIKMNLQILVEKGQTANEV